MLRSKHLTSAGRQAPRTESARRLEAGDCAGGLEGRECNLGRNYKRTFPCLGAVPVETCHGVQFHQARGKVVQWSSAVWRCEKV